MAERSLGDHSLPDRAVASLSRRALLRAALGAAAVGALGAACRGEATPTGGPPSAATGPTATAGPSGAPGYSVALSQPQKLKVAWTAVTGAQSGVYMASETGAWKDLGLDVELVRMGSSSQLAAALRAGELDGGVLDWALAFQFQSQGGNAREVAAITNRQIFSVVSQPSITQPQDVIGKRWGITRLGSAAHTASLLALDMWGIRPDQVQFLAMQDVPAILVGMQAGGVEVGTVSPPTSTRALQAGLHQLVDLAEQGPEYPSIGLAIAERYVNNSPDVVRAYVAGYASGVARFRKNPDRALEVLRKYLQIEDEDILRDTYDRFSRYLAYPPTLPMSSLERIKNDLAQEDPAVAQVAVSDVAAPQFADDLQAHDYFASLL
ncbi:MAG TPA: ABC transporter substrate-binding protein [Chloroflexota bacterium]|nr:ABC transporter substrate-binding protein [Chloroflexota bacterium]